MKIPLADLNEQHKNLKQEIEQAIANVVNKSNFILGEEVAKFEQEIQKYFSAKFAIGVASGTDALVLSLMCFNLKQTDEVITTPFTFIATAEAITRAGAKPVFCDIDSATYNINLDEIEKKITSKTRGIVVVHLYGMPAELDKVKKIAEKHKLFLIEDCAQSFGADFNGKKAGTFGEAGCLSFFPAKTLGALGDGGMIITDREDIADKVRMFRNHGTAKKYYYKMHGFNSRLDTLQAAILNIKLKYIDKWITLRIEKAKYYNKLLAAVKNIVIPVIPTLPTKHGFNYYTVAVKNNKRNALMDELSKNDIACAVYYPLCLHLQEVYMSLGYKKGDFKTAEGLQEEVLSLPMYPELSLESIDKICSVIKNAV